MIGIAAKSSDGPSAGLAWPSHLLAMLKNLGEPGVGVGRGEEPPVRVGSAALITDGSASWQYLDPVTKRIIRFTECLQRYFSALMPA